MGRNSTSLNGSSIARLRGLKGWTQEKLAENARIDKKTIENAEAEKRVSHVTLGKIAHALGVQPQELLPTWAVDDDAAAGLKSHLLSFDALIDERAEGFVGRTYILEALHAFLDDETVPSGYFVVEGKPGMGKTALLAQLIKTRGWRVHHFNTATQGIHTTAQCLGNICARLVSQYGLTRCELPSDFADSSAFLIALLQEAADGLGDDERLVIVVDALDEVRLADGSESSNVLFLPCSLPPRVYFVVSARDLSSLRFRVTHLRKVVLRGDDSKNLADVRECIASRIKQPALKAWVARHKLSKEALIGTIADKSEGNFMYLHYVLPEMESGAYTDLALDAIPEGLENYYEDHWGRMGMAVKPRPRIKLNILYCLSKTKRPVSRALLADFSGVDEVVVQEVLDDWRPFLDEQRVDGTPRYTFYHASFRDFLHRKDIVRAAGVNLRQIGNQIADSILGELFTQ